VLLIQREGRIKEGKGEVELQRYSSRSDTKVQTIELKEGSYKNGQAQKHTFHITFGSKFERLNLRQIFQGNHLLQTILHMAQLFLGYCVMLAVMTFNVWLGLSVLAGAGLGYLLIGWSVNIASVKRK